MREVEELRDSQLMVLIGRYEDAALAEVYRRHGRAAFGLAKRVVGDADEAQDVVQEVFVGLWQKPDRFDPGRGSLRTYVLTQVHSKSVDLVRSRVARQRREEGDARSTTATNYDDLEREVWDLALAERVATAVAALPSEERAAIQLAYFESRTYREVAQLLSQPEGTVKSRIRNGLRRMRATLVEGGVRG